MQIPGWIRGAASVCALGLVGGSLASNVAYAAPSPSAPSTTATATPTRTPAAPKATPAPTCDDATKLTILSFNDFHGRIAKTGPDTVGFFGEIEKMRQAAGAANTLVLSNGDNIGGSLFESSSQQDNPTIDILNTVPVDVSSVGNHEYDKGKADFNDRVQPRAKFPYVAANITGEGAPKPYAIVEKAGVKVAVIGAVTGDLPSLVSPTALTGLTVGDPVDAVNKYAAELKDGNPDNGEADVIIAAYHEGALGSSADLATETAASAMFKKMVEKTDGRVAAVYNAHTHQTYAYDGPAATGTRPVMQSGSYAALIGKVELGIDPQNKGVVDCYTKANVKPTMTADQATANGADGQPLYPNAVAIKKLVDSAISEAAVIGAQVIGSTTGPITRSLPGGTENRGGESAMTDLIAQQFKDVLGPNDPDFIGMQNPGGTRADFKAGDITYKDAASVLPFANTLKTVQVTGAQLKTVFEQQWQRDDKGNVPSRAYLQLGVSQNVQVAYDESRKEGDRITSIFVSGKPVDQAKLYTVGSGNFLVEGGDNFWEFKKGTNLRDTGRVDLEAWVDWIKAKKTLTPDFGKQLVSVSPAPAAFEAGKAQTFAVGVPVANARATDTLDMSSTGATPNTELIAEFTPNGGKPVQVGRAAVTDGRVPSIAVTLPAGTSGPGVLKFIAQPTVTVAQFAVTVTGTSNAVCGLKDNGCFETTPEGAYYWSDHSPRSLVKGRIADRWAAQGWENGALGYPLMSEFCGLRDGGCYQRFQGGSIYWTLKTDAHIVRGAIFDKWGTQGWETGRLGYPTTDEFCGLRDGGCGQHFTGGSIYWSPATGAHTVWGAIRAAYQAIGWERSPLGFPTSDEFCGLRDGGCGQRFAGGLTLFSPKTGAHSVYGAIYTEYARLGWETSQLGYPLGGEFCGLKDGGCGQHFSGGSIYWSPATGAHEVWGAIRDQWARNGWEAGRYGYPTSAESCGPVNGAWECRQDFRGGRITWNSVRGFI